MSNENPALQPEQPAPFDPNAPHQQKPKLRPVRAFATQINGQQAMGLADARQISDRVVFMPPAAQLIFPHMTGERTLDEIVSAVGHGLMRPVLELREFLDQWISEALKSASDPSLDVLPKAIVAPHLDYGRGWINYAAVWGRLRVVDRPDRVVILGTNHFGEGTGVVACDKGYQTALGVCPPDGELIAYLRKRLGDTVFANRFDHEREHSVELQVPWIQHVLGANDKGEFCKVFGALVHDPAVNNGESYDGTGVGLQDFVDAMKDALRELPGKTLVVSSADLSHVGPMFGDQVKTLAGEEQEAAEFRNKVFEHDRELIQSLVQLSPDDVVSSMAWQQNPTRWCSTGNLVATMKIVEPSEFRVLNYIAAMDEQGVGMVSCMAAVLV